MSASLAQRFKPAKPARVGRSRLATVLPTTLLAIFLLAALGGCERKPELPATLTNAAEHYSAAITAQQLGDYPEALLQTRRALRLRPDNVDARWLLSTLLLESGDPAAAELALERMVQLGMSTPDLPIRMARLQLLLNKPVALLESRVPDIDDKNIGTVAALHYLRGKTYTARNWSDEAREEYIRAIDLFEAARREAKTSPEALSLRREMWLLRSTDDDIKAAYAHANCGVGELAGEPPPTFVLPASKGRTLRVGSAETYRQPSQAAAAARDGDTIRIAAGQYRDAATWRANDLKIIGERNADGGPGVEIVSSASLAGDAALWLVEGDRNVVDGVSFTGAKNSSNSAAGLKLTGAGLVVRHSRFVRNQNGLLTNGQAKGAIGPSTNLVDVDPDLGSHVLIEFSEFGYNGVADENSTAGIGETVSANNVTIGREDRLTFRYNYSHHALGGDLLQSAARINNIRSNRLSDEQEYITRYLINLPQGGVSYIVGNVMYQSFRPGNQIMINFGTEEAQDSHNRLTIISNSAMNQSVKGVFANNAISVPASLGNNLFFGTSGTLVRGPVEQRFNELAAIADVVDSKAFNYRLTRDSSLIDTGVVLRERDGIRMYADAEYVHPMQALPRLKVWKPDIGAYEFCRNTL